MSPYHLLMVLLNTLLLVCGQFLWKLGMQKEAGAFGSARSVLQLFVSPYVLAGLVLYGIATVLWLYILSRVELSLAYPVQSFAYILAVFGAYYIFQEPLNAAKITGCLLILAGVACISWKG